MQMQTNVTPDAVPTKDYKLGDTVTWKSHAAGITTSKIGTVVAVIPPEGNMYNGSCLTKTFLVKLLRECRGITRDEARKYVDSQTYYSHWKTDLVAQKYKMKFSFQEGTYRDGFHYLIEVDRGSTLKPLLYHPNTKNLSFAD